MTELPIASSLLGFAAKGYELGSMSLTSIMLSMSLFVPQADGHNRRKLRYNSAQRVKSFRGLSLGSFFTARLA